MRVHRVLPQADAAALLLAGCSIEPWSSSTERERLADHDHEILADA